MWERKVRWESKMTPSLRAEGVMFEDRGPRWVWMWDIDGGGLMRRTSDLEVLSWRKLWAIQLFTSLKQSTTAARLPGSFGLSGRYICVSSA